MAKAHILVVEDEPDILDLLQYNLEEEGFQVTTAVTGEDAVYKAMTLHPNLILLDLMLPGIDGFDVCRTLKGDHKTAGIPIIMITAKGEESDIISGLELGADDYITKPFRPKILIARVRSVLRRQSAAVNKDNAPKAIANLFIDPARVDVKVDNQSVSLTATEFHILNFLANHPGWVFTRSQIIDSIKGSDYPVTDRSVDVQIVGLRKKLGSAGHMIETVRGIGYRFREE
ncbi:response regulator transcription factor [bacterium]|nr:response regulator transcription factor [bacterium]